MELIDVQKNAPPYGSDVTSVDMMDLDCPDGVTYLQALQDRMA
jgi:hypothetical protein